MAIAMDAWGEPVSNASMIRAAAVVAVLVAVSSAHAVVFYDGSVDASATAHGLTYIPLGVATLTTAGGATTLNTTPINMTYAGLGTNAVPLDRNAGYTLRVDAKVLSDSHSGNADRAGFSLLVVSGDLKAIEIGFHANEIFSQNDVTATASRGEAVATDTTSAIREYDLVVLGNGYTLKANGAQILTGALRDYTNFGGAPYTTPNSIFFGDDTTSAQGSTQFSYASVTTVPEPGTLVALGAIAIATRRRRQRV